MSRMPKAGAEDCYTSDSQDWASWVTRPQLVASGQATPPAELRLSGTSIHQQQPGDTVACHTHDRVYSRTLLQKLQ